MDRTKSTAHTQTPNIISFVPIVINVLRQTSSVMVQYTMFVPQTVTNGTVAHALIIKFRVIKQGHSVYQNHLFVMGKRTVEDSVALMKKTVRFVMEMLLDATLGINVFRGDSFVMDIVTVKTNQMKLIVQYAPLNGLGNVSLDLKLVSINGPVALNQDVLIHVVLVYVKHLK